MLKDIRYGLRVLMQAKGWTTVVILSLAVGIGANAVIVTAANAMLLRKLAVDDPDSLVRLRHVGRNDMATDSSDYGFTARQPLGSPNATFSYPMYQQFRAANKTLVDLAGSVPFARLTTLMDGRAETVSAMLVTGNFHSLLGVHPRLGRTITPADDAASAPPVAVLSERYWRSRFSGDAGVLGRVIMIANVAVTVVGVTPAEFTGNQLPLAEPRDITLPIALDTQVRGEERLSRPTDWFVQVMGRLKPGVTIAQVQGNLEGVFRDQARAGMDAYLAGLSEKERTTAANVSRAAIPHFFVEDGSRGIYDANTNDARALEVIGAVAALVLLLVCANVANLLLSRATFRQRELQVRLTMGATRARLIRQLLTESLILAFAGGAAGMLVAIWGQALLPAPIGTTGAPDPRVVVAMVAVTVLVGILFGIAPALRATRLDPATSLNENSRSVAGTRAVLTRALLVAQVSISVVLLVGAGLFLRTLGNLRSVDIGYDPNNLVFIRTASRPVGDDIDRGLRFVEQGLGRLRAVPGVRAATVSAPTLLSGGISTTGMFVQGRDYPSRRDRPSGMAFSIHRVVVAPNFFETMGIGMVAGRGFSERDHMKAPRVAIINQAAARKFFENENPIGKRFGSSEETSSETEIVGIVRDVHYNSLREAPPPTLYTPYLQRGAEGLVFTVRTAAEPSAVIGAIREAVAQVDPKIPIAVVETQMSQIERRFAQEKVLAQAYALFAGIALFIAAIGLFGVMSYGVARRTREIGIRMAIGAQRNEVLSLVASESMVLVAAGVAIGVAVALGTGRFVASHLFGVEPRDLASMIAAVGLMLAVSTIAGVIPARRATRVDPMVALRYE